MRNINDLERAPAVLLVDMDDTLFDTEALNQDLIERFLSSQDISLAQEDRAFIIGASITEIFQRVLPSSSADLIDQFYSYKSEALSSISIRMCSGYEKFIALPIPKVIVSGSGRKEIEAVFVSAGADLKAFDDIYPIERYVHGKPHPAGYQMAIMDRGISPLDALVIEDSHAGISSAHKAGAPAVFVREFARGEITQRADYHASTIMEVVSVLERIL